MRQTLEMALEALELHGQQYPHMVKGYCLDAITAIKEALAQPEQEPFGHVTVRRLSQRFENHHDQFQFYPAGQSPYLDNVDECYALYTTPPQPEQKPVAEVVMATRPPKASPAWRPFKTVCASIPWLDSIPVGTRLYTTPPQRKPLTDEQIEDLYFDNFSMGQLKAFARAIEAAHNIKDSI